MGYDNKRAMYDSTPWGKDMMVCCAAVGGGGSAGRAERSAERRKKKGYALDAVRVGNTNAKSMKRVVRLV